MNIVYLLQKCIKTKFIEIGKLCLQKPVTILPKLLTRGPGLLLPGEIELRRPGGGPRGKDGGEPGR